LYRHWFELVLLEQLFHPLAALELIACPLVEVRGELGEGRHVPILREIETKPARDLAHRLDLGSPAHAGHREAGGDRGADASIEEVGEQVDLAIGDRDDIGGDVGGDVARQRLDDGQGGERAAPVLLVHARRALQQAGVQVEDVAGIGLAARGTAKQERDLPVGPGVLREVVVDHQHVLPLVHEVLAHRGGRIGRDVPQWRRLAGGRGDDDRVLERPTLIEDVRNLGDGRGALADRHVDADDVLAFLVDDGVKRDRRLTRLPVTDDQLPLPSADGGHGVDGFESRLERGVDRLPGDDTRSHLFDGRRLLRLDGAFAVDRLAERVDHPPDQGLAHRDLDDTARGADLIAFADLLVGSQDDGAHRVLFQVECHAADATLELEQLQGAGVAQAVDLRDPVSDFGDDTNVRREDGHVEVLDALFDQVADLV